MNAHAYSEDQLVEQPAIGLFAELGWTTVSALEETFGATGTLLRETKGEVVLVSRLRAALERLNPALPPEAITAAVDELTRDRSAMSLEAANREVYLLLKEGIKVSVPDTDSTMPINFLDNSASYARIADMPFFNSSLRPEKTFAFHRDACSAPNCVPNHSRYSSAPSTPAIPSWFCVPVSNLYGSSSEAGLTL